MTAKTVTFALTILTFVACAEEDPTIAATWQALDGRFLVARDLTRSA